MDFFHTSVSPRAIELVNETLQSTFLSEGRRVKEFELALESRLGIRHPVALNSGTSALHLALVLAGVGPGDEVILPAQTFVATGLAILMQGAVPVFADIDPLTGNISAAAIAAKISPRTRAVIPVHWAGYPCDLDEINTLATAQGLAVIEDAAHALGAAYKSKPVGAISRFTAFSFQAIKHLTTGDGGALCCMAEFDAQLATTRRWFSIDRANSKPSILGERAYDISALGYKYHLNDLAAAVGLGNLDDFPARLARRREIARQYRHELADVPGLQLLTLAPDRTHAYWLFSVLVDRREDFIRKLAASKIPSSVVHLRIDHNSIFGGIRKDLPGQAEFDARQVSIPVHEALTAEDVDSIIRTIRSGW
jgi:perosamine synthetase